MPEPMTIGYLTSFYARASDTFIRGEVAQLRALGHAVHTFSSRRPDPGELIDEAARRERENTEYLVETGAWRQGLATLREAIRSPRRFLAAARRAVGVGAPGLDGRLRPFAYLAQGAYLAGRLRAAGIQHLHNHIGESSAAVAMLASTFSGVPYSLTVHGPNEFDDPIRFALGAKVRHSAFTVAVSDYGRSQLYRWSDFADWPKVRVVRCGVDGRFLDGPRAPIPEEPRLVCVGRLAEQKGQLLLVEALAQLAERGVEAELALVGDGPMRGPIERLAAERGLGGRVRLLGWLDAEGVRREVLRSRAMVLPSFAEGLPVVLMEALALGRPVVSTFVAGIPELVEPGTSGWLVPAGSAEALGGAGADVRAADVDELERMGRAGAERVARRHDAAAEAAKLAGLIAGCYDHPDRPADRTPPGDDALTPLSAGRASPD